MVDKRALRKSSVNPGTCLRSSDEDVLEDPEDSFLVNSSDDELDDFECQEFVGKPPDDDEEEEDSAQSWAGRGEAGVLCGTLLDRIGAWGWGTLASDTVLRWINLITFPFSLAGSSDPFKVEEDKVEELAASESGSSDPPSVSVDSLHRPASRESRASVDESTTLDNGFLVSKSRDLAKQNSADALSHKGKRNGVPERNDSKLVQEERERKLVQTDYSCMKTIHHE